MCGAEDAQSVNLTTSIGGNQYGDTDTEENVDLCKCCMIALSKSYLILAAIPPQRERDEDSGFKAVNRYKFYKYDSKRIVDEEADPENLSRSLGRYSLHDPGFSKFIINVISITK